MSAPVLPLQPVKNAPGPAPLTAEQSYWHAFKSTSTIATTSYNPVTHISHLNHSHDKPSSSEYFAVTTGSRVQLYSIRTRKLGKTISRFDDTAHGAEIRPDGRVMVAGDDTGTIQVFDVHSRAILRTWKEHKQPVWTTKFSDTSSTSLMSTGDDRTVRLWDLPSQNSISTFSGHQDYVRCGGFMTGQASSLLVSGSYDQTVRIWDPRTPAAAVMTFKHAAPIEAVLPLPTGTTILAAADNQITVLDLVAARPQRILKNHQKTVTSLCLASKDGRLVSGGLDGHLKVFETSSWNVVYGTKYPSAILALSVIQAGETQEDRHLVVGMESGSLSIKTRLSGQQKARERARQKEMQALLEGDQAKLEKIDKKKQTQGQLKRRRGENFLGEGADIVIEGRPQRKHKLRRWEEELRKGHYGPALDEVLSQSHLSETVTLLTALRHRSALRAALSGRDDGALQPISRWTCKHIMNPQHVPLCVDIGMIIIELYAENAGESEEMDQLTRRLHRAVRLEVERSQQAWQTKGMVDMLINAAD